MCEIKYWNNFEIISVFTVSGYMWIRTRKLFQNNFILHVTMARVTESCYRTCLLLIYFFHICHSNWLLAPYVWYTQNLLLYSHQILDNGECSAITDTCWMGNVCGNVAPLFATVKQWAAQFLRAKTTLQWRKLSGSRKELF